MDIAKTIHQQMYAIDANAMMCIGAHGFVAHSEALVFKASGANVKRGGRVEVKLNGLDLYDVTVYRIVKFERRIIEEVKNVYAEDLCNIVFEIIG